MIATTLFELLFGVRPRLPSLPAPEIQQHQYGESFPAECLQLLQHARQVACKNAEQQDLKYKLRFDQTAVPHKFEFKVDQKIWLSDTTALGKNPKLTPKWVGPYKIVDLNDYNAKIELKPNKFKVINISRLKAYKEDKKCLSEDATCLPQGNPSLFEDFQTYSPPRPMTRALKRLIDYKNAATMAISILNNDLKEECDGNMFAEHYDKYYCGNCYNGIRNFSHFACQTNVFLDPRNLIEFLQKINHNEGAFTYTLCDLIKNNKYC